jgi:hypothetical protein
MLTDLLDGTLPNLQDILLIQSSILEARDIYQPWRLGKQLLETKDLEVRPCMLFLAGKRYNATYLRPCSAQAAVLALTAGRKGASGSSMKLCMCWLL